jgi:hypothetical protein
LPDAGSKKKLRRLPAVLPRSKWTSTQIWKDGSGSTVTTNFGSPIDLSGIQITDSESHPFHSSYKKGRINGDLGGPFRTTKSYIPSSDKNFAANRVRIASSTNEPLAIRQDVYEGPVLPGLPAQFGPLYPPTLESSDVELQELGTTAIARCAPGNSPADVVTFLGELLKDGIPSLVGHQSWKDRALTARAAGSEYLNLAFGWAPLVKDISSFANALIHAEKVLAQYERDAGKVVRRRYQFPTTRSNTQETLRVDTIPYSTISGGFMYDQTRPRGDLVRTREIERRQWFSGAFTYYLPVGYDSRVGFGRLASLAQHLLGIHLTPDVLWELTPWSWAIDWFTNTGDIIHNLSRFADGGLVLRYGYMMEHTIVKDIYTMTTTNMRGYSSVPPLTMVTETKKRVKAHPFGFGMTWDGMSTFQASILAALGITRFGR